MESGEELAFWDLLRRYEEEQRSDIHRQIHQRFTEALAVLVVDTSGFTRSLASEGAVAALVRLLRLERLLPTIVEPAGGRLLPREADNFLALFPDPVVALRSALRILSEVERQNEDAPENERLEVSLGVGYGPVLLVGEEKRPMGAEVNLAFKLGEDVARPNEILVTEQAFRVASEAGFDFERMELALSGLTVVAYRVVG